MNVKNITKKRIIAENAKLCRNIFSKSLGLMFTLKAKPLIFIFEREKIIRLHMLFVFYTIDVLFLDKKKIVVEMKENLRPFSFYSPKEKAKYVIELGKNTIKTTKTQIGNKIEFDFK